MNRAVLQGSRGQNPYQSAKNELDRLLDKEWKMAVIANLRQTTIALPLVRNKPVPKALLSAVLQYQNM